MKPLIQHSILGLEKNVGFGGCQIWRLSDLEVLGLLCDCYHTLPYMVNVSHERVRLERMSDYGDMCWITEVSQQNEISELSCSEFCLYYTNTCVAVHCYLLLNYNWYKVETLQSQHFNVLSNPTIHLQKSSHQPEVG